MDKKDIYKKCTGKAEELLDKYYHNYLLDAAVLRPEILEPEYNLELPRKVEAERFCDAAPYLPYSFGVCLRVCHI